MKSAIKRLFLIVLAVIFTLMLTSCGNIQETMDDPDVREKTETMMDALLGNDFNSSYSLMKDTCTEAEFQSFFKQVRLELKNVDSYELNAIHAGYTVNDGQKFTQLQYLMETERGNFVINSVVLEGQDGLYGFHIASEEQTALKSTGEIGSMDGATTAQWVMLAIAAVETVFVIFVFIDCCRRKLKRKWLLLLVIIFGCISLGLSTSGNNIRFNFSITSILNYSAFIMYGDGSSILRLLIPFGAIAYLVLRKRYVIAPVQDEAEVVSVEDSEAENKIEG